MLKTTLRRFRSGIKAVIAMGSTGVAHTSPSGVTLLVYRKKNCRNICFGLETVLKRSSLSQTKSKHKVKSSV